MQSTYTLLSGGSVVIDAPYDVESGNATNFFTVSVSERSQELKAGITTFAETVAREVVGVLVFDEEYTYQGGRLRMGSAIEIDPVSNNVTTRRSAVWEGKKFSLNTNISGGYSADLVAILDEFDFRETDDGLALDIRRPNVTKPNRRLHPPQIAKQTQRLGLVTSIERNGNSEYRVPGWGGKKVRGGDLYKTESPGQTTRFLLVGGSAITEIIPDPGASPEEVAENAANLVVEWRP